MHYPNSLSSISKFKINNYTAIIYAANTDKPINQDTFNESTKRKCDENLVVSLKNIYSNIRNTTVCMTDQISEDVTIEKSRTIADNTVKKYKINLALSSKKIIRILSMTF